MSSVGYHEPVSEMSDETRDMHRAIISLMEELEAVDWYNQRVDACKDPELRASSSTTATRRRSTRRWCWMDPAQGPVLLEGAEGVPVHRQAAHARLDEDHRSDRRHELGVDRPLLPARQRERQRSAWAAAFARRCVLLQRRLRTRSSTLQHAGDWDAAGALLADAARALERAGADFLVLCTNTMHNVAAGIEAAVRIPLLHIADADRGGDQARRGIARGSAGHPLHDGAGVLQGAPDERPRARGHRARAAADREIVHRIIYDELCLGRCSTVARGIPPRHRGLADRGAQASSWAAPRSDAGRRREDRRCPCSTPPPCTRARPPSGPSTASCRRPGAVE